MIQILIMMSVLVSPNFTEVPHNLERKALLEFESIECSKDEDCRPVDCYYTFCEEYKCYMTLSCV